MAVWSTVYVSGLYDSRRLDAEFYKPEYLESEERLGKYPLRNLAKLTSKIDVGHVGPMTSQYSDEGVLLLQTRNVRPFFLRTQECARITPAFHEQLRKSQVHHGDILLARSGSFGAAAMHFGKEVLNSADIIIIQPIAAEVEPLYLLAFINSWYGQFQLQRFVSGGVQGHVNLTILEGLQVPLLPRKLQVAISQTITLAHSELQKAERLYSESEVLLESALGLDKLDLTTRLSYERHYKGVTTASRFDAEYFQPRMQNLIARLSKSKQHIRDVAKLSKRRFTPTAGKAFQYIEIGDVLEDGTAESSSIMGEDAPSRATWIVRPGDIITTTVRPIRRLSAIISDSQTGSVCSSGFAVLTAEGVPPELLLVFLRLRLVCELLDLHTTASMYPAIATGDLMQIPIAVPDKHVTKKIVRKVLESFDAHRNAERLLEDAKEVVEKAVLDG